VEQFFSLLVSLLAFASSRDNGEKVMGLCLDPTPEMGEWTIEIRRESFWLRGPTEDDYIEILKDELPKVKAALAQVDEYLALTCRK
jgi:hypothetical protein